MLFFAHNAHNRPKILRKTIDIEKELFPEAKHYVSLTTDGGIDHSLFPEAVIIPTIGVGHHPGCVNCFYSCISKICEDHEDGIIIFTHDDVSICNVDLVKSFIKLVEGEASYVLRRPFPYSGLIYFTIEVVFLRISRIKEFFLPHSNQFIQPNDIYKYIDHNGWISTEVWAGNHMKNIKGGIIIHEPMIGQGMKERLEFLKTTFGFHHENFGVTGWIE